MDAPIKEIKLPCFMKICFMKFGGAQNEYRMDMSRFFSIAKIDKVKKILKQVELCLIRKLLIVLIKC